MNLKKNKHLKEVEKILDDWDENKGYLTANDQHGVDLISPIDIKELDLDIEDEDEIATILEQHYDNSDYLFEREKDGYHEFALVASSCEDIIITYEGHLCFPETNDETTSVKLSSDNREIEIIAYTLEWMNESGYFPSIYQHDYNGCPTSYNFHDTNEYKALNLSDDEKKQAKEVSRLVEIIEFQKYLEENTQSLGELPHEFYEALPTFLQENDGDFEVISVESFDAHTLTIEFEAPDYDEDLGGLEELLIKKTITQGNSEFGYSITISLLPNSVRFMKGLDDLLGLTLKETA